MTLVAVSSTLRVCTQSPPQVVLSHASREALGRKLDSELQLNLKLKCRGGGIDLQVGAPATAEAERARVSKVVIELRVSSR